MQKGLQLLQMRSLVDTIVAPITGSGTAAVAVIRVSGPDAWAVAQAVFRPWKPEPLRARHGSYSFGDDGIALPFSEGHSYTGEQTVELSVHGSPAAVQMLLEACLAAGARIAEPGEFTARAFLNGRMDLAQAQGVREVIEAGTKRQFQAASRLKGGVLSQEVEAIRGQVMECLATLEAYTDFGEDLEPLDMDAFAGRLSSAANDLRLVLDRAETARRLRRGIRILLAGRPNAGKSSLFNALLNNERAIVTPVPGTTRDYLEESLEWDGLPVTLIDTAGLRPTDDPVEQIGVDRTIAESQAADLVWFLYDCSLGWTEEDQVALSSISFAPVTVLASKCDIGHPDRGIPISAMTLQGLDTLTSLVHEQFSGYEEAVPVHPEQGLLLKKAMETLEGAKFNLLAGHPPDLICTLLQDALRALGKVTGLEPDPDMVREIFSRFCLGK